MRGPDAVRDACAALLKWDLPKRIPLLRRARQLDQRRLPDIAPSAVISGERPDNMLTSRNRSWVEVINPRKVRSVQVDLDAYGNPVYRSRWGLRIYIWALAPGWDEALAARDNLMSAVSSSLLEYPTLNTDPAGGDTGFLVHVDTLTEEPGTPIRIGRGAAASRVNTHVWAPGVLAYQMDDESSLAEGSTRPALGVADQITVTPTAAGPLTPL